MAMRIKVIFLACAVGCVFAQYSDVDVLPQRGLAPGRGRVQRLQGTRSGPPVQSVLGGQRVRRPILRTRPAPLEDAPEIPVFPGVRGPRPGLSSVDQNDGQGSHQSIQQSQQVKPVSEESEEDEEDVAQAIANLGAVSNIPQSSGDSISGTFTPAPAQYRPSSSTLPARPTPLPQQNITPVQYRPSKPTRPRKPSEEVAEVRVPIKQQRPQGTKPTGQGNGYDNREKKPVAQIIRRYREDNPDGSITWGFENDDGSYKEELIGVDCVTRGKYGYIDPDGLRREYTYETGIKCDEEQQQAMQDKENGFVDYQENKLVLPGGQTIDLSSMGKKQTRRPQPVYRN